VPPPQNFPIAGCVRLQMILTPVADCPHRRRGSNGFAI
jgi:hypothetical protein